MRINFVATASLLVSLAGPARGEIPDGGKVYSWARRNAAHEPLEGRFAPPSGFKRVAAPPGSYGAWLRRLPLLPAGSPVKSFRGSTWGLVKGSEFWFSQPDHTGLVWHRPATSMEI